MSRISHRRGHHQAWIRLAGLVCVAALGGCSSMNPANWFHQREGGVIAQPQKPTPGANQPYPNLATIPPEPPPPDRAAMEAITTGLVSDRAHARHLAEAAPLADPSLPAASPGLFGVGTVPPPPPGAGQPVATASLPAVSTPPPAEAAAAPVKPLPPAQPASRGNPTVTPPARAPRAAVQSVPLAGPTMAPAAPAIAPASPSVASAVPSAPLAAPAVPARPVGPAPAVLGTTPSAAPAIPPAPPPAPVLSGAVPPAPKTAAQGAAVASLPPATMPEEPARPGSAVEIAFAAGSASLPESSRPALKALAAKRGNNVIEALGRGEAVSATPKAQEDAVTLGFARAQAIAAALAADGVPRGAIQVMSLAGGRGGMAKLIE